MKLLDQYNYPKGVHTYCKHRVYSTLHLESKKYLDASLISIKYRHYKESLDNKNILEKYLTCLKIRLSCKNGHFVVIQFSEPYLPTIFLLFFEKKFFN